ncbi:acyltransferase family protein [Bradyrhizobium cenepequi]|uniref:acyltransferase family protein n=1 Tax=Bradyrhizobium cenepequi TaxID=2821403 RepID=UPI001CE250E9|nr:acyltransferase [Bradyrhizobium cenepequi]MCA6112788.1 acyltransferase [Bradyrhizobium cenepequi]
MGFVRFTLALVVLLAHSGYGATSIGALASVEAFFVLSGIYMAAAYHSKYGLMANGTLLFYANRVLRLWPTYLVLLALTASTYLALGRPRGDQLQLFNLFYVLEQQGLTATNSIMLVLSIIPFGQDVASVRKVLHFMLPVPQSRSIAAELLFYLFVPVLYRFRAWQPFLLAFVVLMGVKCWLLGLSWRLAYFLPFGNFGYFALSYGLYLLFNTGPLDALRQQIWPARHVLTLAIVVMTFSFCESSFECGGVLHHTVYIVVFSVASIMLFARAVSRFDAFLGNISYGIYLNHLLLVVVMSFMGFKDPPRLVVFLAGSILLAIFMEKVVQNPVDQYRYQQTSLQ